jgi:hypothetical protein
MADSGQNDPIGDELDDAVMFASELVAGAKRIGMASLEPPIRDKSNLWTVTVKRADLREHQVPSADGNGANRGRHDGELNKLVSLLNADNICPIEFRLRPAQPAKRYFFWRPPSKL